jgi:hypothetical protein
MIWLEIKALEEWIHSVRDRQKKAVKPVLNEAASLGC